MTSFNHLNESNIKSCNISNIDIYPVYKFPPPITSNPPSNTNALTYFYSMKLHSQTADDELSGLAWLLQVLWILVLHHFEKDFSCEECSMKRKWLTTALTIAVESAQIVSPWIGQQHACQTDVSNVHSHCSLHTMRHYWCSCFWQLFLPWLITQLIQGMCTRGCIPLPWLVGQ